MSMPMRSVTSPSDSSSRSRACRKREARKSRSSSKSTAPSRCDIGCASKITRSISRINSSVIPCAEHSSSTNCCDRYRARGYSAASSSAEPSSRRPVSAPSCHPNVTDALPRRSLARRKNDASLACAEMALQPAAIISASAVFPEPRAPMIATSPGFSSRLGVLAHGASWTSIAAMTCEGVALTGGWSPTKARPAGSIHAWRRVSNAGSPLSHE